MIEIRVEAPGDEDEIRRVTGAAFDGHPHSDGSEIAIIDCLRADGDLTLSLVAVESGKIVGHIALSPVTISDGTQGWYGLGPVSVLPQRQGGGIGGMLVRHGLAGLQGHGARGFVLLGDPGYYGRFGFAHDPRLSFPGPPPEYFQFLLVEGPMPSGTVNYCPAFG